jgi:hypothetical protein
MVHGDVHDTWIQSQHVRRALGVHCKCSTVRPAFNFSVFPSTTNVCHSLNGYINCVNLHFYHIFQRIVFFPQFSSSLTHIWTVTWPHRPANRLGCNKIRRRLNDAEVDFQKNYDKHARQATFLITTDIGDCWPECPDE